MKKLFFLTLISLVVMSYSCEDGGEPMNTQPTLSIADIEVTEGDTNNTIAVTVSLSGENLTNVIVGYATLAGTAMENLDFTAVDGDLTFGPNEVEKTINIPIKGDMVDEPDETFEVVLLNPINATFTKNRGVVTILNDDTGNDGGLVIPTTGFVTPTSYADYTLVWSDEFQGTGVNTADWNYEIGASGWGNNELQYYRPGNNSYIAQGEFLVIEAREESYGGANYTSTRMTTEDKQEFQYGRIDIRAVLPEGQGIWPALWMLGGDFGEIGWPDCGEIDIMELVGHQPSTVYGTVHYGADPSQHHYTGSSRSLTNGSKYSDEFHVFSLIWEEDKVEILMDNVKYFEFTPTQIVDNQPYPFNQPFFFIFNIAVGGQWPGNPDASTVFPQRMIVDYVRVFQ